jgi:hypothetical protein
MMSTRVYGVCAGAEPCVTTRNVLGAIHSSAKGTRARVNATTGETTGAGSVADHRRHADDQRIGHGGRGARLGRGDEHRHDRRRHDGGGEPRHLNARRLERDDLPRTRRGDPRRHDGCRDQGRRPAGARASVGASLHQSGARGATGPHASDAVVGIGTRAADECGGLLERDRHGDARVRYTGDDRRDQRCDADQCRRCLPERHRPRLEQKRRNLRAGSEDGGDASGAGRAAHCRPGRAAWSGAARPSPLDTMIPRAPRRADGIPRAEQHRTRSGGAERHGAPAVSLSKNGGAGAGGSHVVRIAANSAGMTKPTRSAADSRTSGSAARSASDSPAAA